EVITSAFTFSSCAHVVVHLGATPVLADICEDDWNVDPADIERRITSGTRALMPVHYGGQPCRMDDIVALAKARGLFVLDDAAHAIGAAYRGLPVGSLADATAFSFYATKNVAMGEGGALTTADAAIDERARRLALHGMNRDAWQRYETGGSWYYEVVEAGYKYNLTDIQSALGLAQLTRLDWMTARRAELAARYTAAFASMDELGLPAVRPEVRHAWHLYAIRIRPEALRIDRNRFIALLAERGIGTSVHFIPVYRHPFYRDTFGLRPEDFPVTERVYQTCISLPLYPGMTDAEADRVIEAVGDIVRKEQR
ncbi:MAG TPA: DegT/DnrJ/EryC1/StrS family aminotransferase, partial [Dehalococcoidia bacterium]|nr:DegT/DnrJ/EryC1/StrS family aminotransferase [Dehalococcoidia bacterium]